MEGVGTWRNEMWLQQVGDGQLIWRKLGQVGAVVNNCQTWQASIDGLEPALYTCPTVMEVQGEPCRDMWCCIAQESLPYLAGGGSRGLVEHRPQPSFRLSGAIAWTMPTCTLALCAYAGSCLVTDTGIMYLASPKHPALHHSLRRLAINHTSATEASVCELLMRCTSLRDLGLRGLLFNADSTMGCIARTCRYGHMGEVFDCYAMSSS